MWRSLRRLGVPESETPDAVQDVFIVVHRKLSGFEGRSKLTTWLFGICLRVASDRRRKAYRHMETSDDGAVAERVDSQHDVGAEAERLEGLALLEHILDQLPIEQRAVFTLFELEEMSGDEIAQALGIPTGTVRSRLRLARETFRRACERFRARDSFRASPRGEEP